MIKKLKDNFNIQNRYLSLETGFVAVLSFALGEQIVEYFFGPEAFIGGFWCMISSVVVLQSLVDRAFANAWNRLLAGLIGIATAYFLCLIFGSNYFVLFFSICVSVFITRLIKFYQGTRISGIQAGDIVVLGIYIPNLPLFMIVTTRTLEMIVGILIAVATLWVSQKVGIRKKEAS